MKQETFTPAFKVFKEGTTNGFITIMSKNGEAFNVNDKINKYLSLGYTVQPIDLFEAHETLPQQMQDLLIKWGENLELDYIQCEQFKKECEQLGYTFEYYLDAIPFNLSKIN